jgi:hypothetical protein
VKSAPAGDCASNPWRISNEGSIEHSVNGSITLSEGSALETQTQGTANKGNFARRSGLSGRAAMGCSPHLTGPDEKAGASAGSVLFLVAGPVRPA